MCEFVGNRPYVMVTHNVPFVLIATNMGGYFPFSDRPIRFAVLDTFENHFNGPRKVESGHSGNFMTSNKTLEPMVPADGSSLVSHLPVPSKPIFWTLEVRSGSIPDGRAADVIMLARCATRSCRHLRRRRSTR